VGIGARVRLRFVSLLRNITFRTTPRAPRSGARGFLFVQIEDFQKTLSLGYHLSWLNQVLMTL